MNEFNHLTGRQIAAARALLGLGQAELAARASISPPTLRRMEAAGDRVSGYVNNVRAVKQALEEAGITFLADGQAAVGDGVSLRIRSTASSDDKPKKPAR